MDLSSIIKMARQLQEEAKRLKKEIEEKEFFASAGGGAVKVTVKGTGEVVSVKISPDLVESGDAGMIEDLVTVAVNQALRAARESVEKAMGNVVGDLGLDTGGLF